MRVRMTAHLSGTRNGQHWPPRGAEVDLPDAEGVELCAGGLATPVACMEPEAAVAPAPERRARTRKTP